jgi:hypothetical protein
LSITNTLDYFHHTISDTKKFLQHLQSTNFDLNPI